MQRLLFWFAFFFLCSWLWRRAHRPGPRAAPHRRGAAPAQLAEPVVQCAQCGAHAPLSESRSAAGLHFCSDEHARQYLSRH